MKVLLHLGFHKTGTTSLQRTLAKNLDAIADQMAVLLPHDLEAEGFFAKRYCLKAHDDMRAALQDGLAAKIQGTQLGRSLPLLISNENLAGVLPGRKDHWSYHRAADLALALCQAVQQACDNQAEITILLTTRDPEAWMRSVYWQNLRSSRIVEDFDLFRTRLREACDLQAVADQVAAQVAGLADVVTINMSQQDNRSAALEFVLAKLGVSIGALIPIGDQNVRPDGAIAHFLSLNRSSLSDEDLAKIKKAYLKKMLKPQS